MVDEKKPIDAMDLFQKVMQSDIGRELMTKGDEMATLVPAIDALDKFVRAAMKDIYRELAEINKKLK